MLRDLEKEIWNKESQKGKKLGQHIKECKELTLNFLNFYNLNNYRELAEALCYYHDLGKLKDTWSVNNKINPPHSPLSFLIIFNKDWKIIERYPILGLFILRHHGNLIRIEDGDILRIKNEAPKREKEQIDNKIKNWRRHLYKYVSKLDLASKVNLVDTYGLFKFADILSASNLASYRICKLNKNVDDLKSWILEKIQKKGLKVRKETLQSS